MAGTVYLFTMMCWLSVLVLVFAEHAITHNVRNLTLNTSSHGIEHSLSSIASINIYATNTTHKKPVPTTIGIIMKVNNSRTTSTTRYVHHNLSSTPVHNSSGTISRKVILTTSESTSSTYLIHSISTPVISSRHTGIIVKPVKSTSGNIIRMRSTNVARSSVVNSTSHLKRVKTRFQSTYSIKQNTSILASSSDIGNATGKIRTTHLTSIVHVKSSRNTKVVSKVTSFATSLPETIHSRKQVTSVYSKSNHVKEIPSSMYHVSSQSRPHSVVGINHTIRGSTKVAHISSLTTSGSFVLRPTTIGSGKRRLATSSHKILLQSSKLLSPPSSYKKSMWPVQSSVIRSSSRVHVIKSSWTSMKASFTIVITKHSRHLPSSLYSTVLDSSTTSTIRTVPMKVPSSILKSSYLSTGTQQVISSHITPSSHIEHGLETKVAIPGSGKEQLTMEGRIGVAVAISAGIMIIILLLYLAKTKGKLKRYRRYDNTYQIPGFTDVGGMVQLSTIGDSEYEILDATDYTGGDNPLYDLTQNPALHAPYDNNGYTENGHSENIASTNTIHTNTNSPS